MIDDLDQLCRLLAIDAGELDWFADRQGRNRRGSTALQHYSWRVLPKRGGVRVVAAPKTRLKEIQRRLLRHVVDQIPVHPAAHGCVRGRSVRSALEPHAGSRVLIRLDLEAFFPTITAPRVRGLLSSQQVPPPVAAAVTGLCTVAMPVGWAPPSVDSQLAAMLRAPHLPQGAPTSPGLANALAFGLDRRLAALAQRFGATYTRYVDDLLISGGAHAQRHRHRLVDLICAIVVDEGFRPNARKTAVLTHAGRLGGLGAVVNSRPTLPREERDRLRAVVRNCVVGGPDGQSRGRENFRSHLLGRVSAVAALDPVFGARLRGDYERIAWPDDRQ